MTAMMIVPSSIVADDKRTEINVNSDDADWYDSYVQSKIGIVSSKKCGDDITCTIYADRLLRISGTGELNKYYNYSYTFDSLGYAKEIFIEEGITSVNASFENFTNLYYITFPESVSNIESFSFPKIKGFLAIAILNPECKIPDEQININGNVYIYGKENSTASAYAKKYNYIFKNVENDTITKGDNSTSWSIEGNTLTMSGDYDTGWLYNDGYSFSTCFYAKDKVEKLVLEGNMSVINFRAFENFRNLKEVHLNDNMEYIAENAFAGCSSLEKINIPPKFRNASLDAFLGTPWLNSLDGPVKIVNGVVIDGHECTGDVVIPDSVKRISDEAFRGCDKITSVSMSDSVKRIGYMSFAECSSLKKFNASDVTIGGWVFYRSYNLEDINFKSVRQIGQESFYDTLWYKKKCAEDPLIVINGVIIDAKACTGDIVIPENATELNFLAFLNTKNITSLTILNPELYFPDNSYLENIPIFYGYKDSTAEKYAKEYNKKFIALDEQITTTATAPLTTKTTATEAVTSKTTSFETISATTKKATSLTSAITTKLTSAATHQTNTSIIYSQTTQYRYTITRYEAAVKSIDSYPTKTIYSKDEELDFSGLSYTVSRITRWYGGSAGYREDKYDAQFQTYNTDPKKATIIDKNKNEFSGAKFSTLPEGTYRVSYLIMPLAMGGDMLSGMNMEYDVTILPNTTCTTSATTASTTQTTTTTESETTKQSTLPATGYSSAHKYLLGFSIMITLTGIALICRKRKDE